MMICQQVAAQLMIGVLIKEGLVDIKDPLEVRKISLLESIIIALKTVFMDHRTF